MKIEWFILFIETPFLDWLWEEDSSNIWKFIIKRCEPRPSKWLPNFCFSTCESISKRSSCLRFLLFSWFQIVQIFSRFQVACWGMGRKKCLPMLESCWQCNKNDYHSYSVVTIIFCTWWWWMIYAHHVPLFARDSTRSSRPNSQTWLMEDGEFEWTRLHSFPYTPTRRSGGRKLFL